MKRSSIFSRVALPLTAAAMLVSPVTLAACGAPRPIPDESPEEASEDGEGRRSRRRASREDGDEELPLGPSTEIAGTGARIRPPRGSERSAMGSTFIHPRRRIQLVIAAAEGDLSVHQQFRTGLLGDAEEVESDDVEIDGARGTLTIDHMTQGDVELERVWVIARRETRSVAAMGVYQADRSETLRELMRASVLSLTFDEAAPIDPEAAVGWRLAPVEGLELVRTASTNVSYSTDGQPPENASGEPMLMLVPIPIEVPESERGGLCARILDQIVQVPEGATPERQTIEAGEVQGCDLAAEAGEGGAVLTYAALVFRGPAAFMIGGSVATAQRDPWLARFRGAARTLESVGAPAGGSGGDDGDEDDEDEDDDDEDDES